MNWLDIVILVAIGLVALAGWRMGGIHIGVTTAGILVGIAIAGHLHDRVTPFFSRFIDSENGAEIGAFMLIFIVALVASLAIGAMVHALFRTLMLGWFNKAMGLGLGVVVTFAIGSAVFSAIQSYPVLGLEDSIASSTLATFMADNLDVVLRGLKFIPDDLGNELIGQSSVGR